MLLVQTALPLSPSTGERPQASLARLFTGAGGRHDAHRHALVLADALTALTGVIALAIGMTLLLFALSGGKVGIVGYCWGGLLTWRAACTLSGLSAAAP